ncbi:glycoside hydrolase family 16 protein [Aquimarina pacifica]|uniref:glycoside hydrolase family 16 protein n=1 Tax=Aquimarina pacifica TaxID=1296415 RepID=UPI00046EF562|nr:glycoside hydrolase family 16 protein [Aquimarina pacifica]
MRYVAYILLFVFTTSVYSQAFIFEEHFNDTRLNETYWNYDLGDGCPQLCGWGNDERQIYTKENIELKDGKLIITAIKKDDVYTSGKITSKDKIEFQYGTIEVRAQISDGYGLWPAIWMLGEDISEVGWPDCGEIDIMEYIGREPHTIYNSLHTRQSFGNTLNSKKTTVNTIEEGFHVFKSIWTKDKIDFYIDDQLAYTYEPEIKNKKNWPFNKPFYLIINLAIGGNFGGPKVDDSIFPKKFIIDYIRVSK